MGWVQRQRDLGSLIFIDLRDRTGIVQLAFDDKTERSIFDMAFALRSEYVVVAWGTVRPRGEGAVNRNIPTGEIEIFVDELKLLSEAQTPPFEIVENSDVRPEVRLKYRYLDMRRPDLNARIIARGKIAKARTRLLLRQRLYRDRDPPTSSLRHPRGARDYLVPSRVHHGHFYALPQSPQLYKQLLMLSGFDRYMQIARCFRDEDLRADRQPEFTQIDVEMSFCRQDDVIEVTEGFLAYLFREFLGRELSTPLLRLTYDEAMNRFGSDKPDMRFGMELCDLSDLAAGCGFKVFAGAVEAGGSVRGINVKGGARFSRKEIDSLTEYAKTYRAKGVAWLKKRTARISRPPMQNSSPPKKMRQ